MKKQISLKLSALLALFAIVFTGCSNTFIICFKAYDTDGELKKVLEWQLTKSFLEDNRKIPGQIWDQAEEQVGPCYAIEDGNEYYSKFVQSVAEDTKIWYESISGDVFDRSSLITSDMVLLPKYERADNKQYYHAVFFAFNNQNDKEVVDKTYTDTFENLPPECKNAKEIQSSSGRYIPTDEWWCIKSPEEISTFDKLIEYANATGSETLPKFSSEDAESGECVYFLKFVAAP